MGAASDVSRASILASLQSEGEDRLPGLMGLSFRQFAAERGVGVEADFTVSARHMAPNGFLHAAAVVALADSACGYGCVLNLPEGASGFTTIELKTNFLGTATEGLVTARGAPLHLGRSTQLWDAEVTSAQSGRTIALFRCTQMILWPKG